VSEVEEFKEMYTFIQHNLMHLLMH